MKKWCIIDSKESLVSIEVFNSKEEALAEAEKEWNKLTSCDKKQRNSFMVALCNVQEYSPHCWDYAEDENGNIDTDIYSIAKDYDIPKKNRNIR